MEPLDVDRRIWPKILPYLSLCDLECISQTCSTLRELVGQYTNQHGVHIEECCVQTLPIDIYQKYGQFVSILTLNSLPASEANNLIDHFNYLSSLTLININIRERTEIAAFPVHLTELYLIDCKIGEDVFKWRITERNYTLRKLHLRNFEIYTSLFVPAHYRVVNLDRLKDLETLTIEGGASRVEVNSIKLKYLKILSNDLKDVFLRQESGQLLRELHFDVPAYQWKNLKHPRYHNSLQRLTTRDLLPLKELKRFWLLNQLEILQPVDIQFKKEIEALNINTVKVVYTSVSPPPEETNLILKKLNEDCLLKIISHLKVPEWMSFGQVHPTIERILTDHKYPREVIKEKDIDESGISGDLSHFHHVAQFITQYECLDELKYIPILQHQLTALNSLTFNKVNFINVSIEVLPDRLEKLTLLNCDYEGADLAPYFQRLSSTLRVLDIKVGHFGFRVHWLEPLRNIREFRIDSYDVSADLSLFLEHNEISLERFEIELRNLPRATGWRAIEDTLDRIGRMKKLTHLRIQEADYPLAVNSHLVAEVLKNIGPQLKKLAIILSGTKMKEVLESDRLRDLPELEIKVWKSHQEMALTAIASIKNLRKLRIEIKDRAYRLTLLLSTDDLMFLVTSLPYLTAIYTPRFEANLSFEREFQEYLRRTKRTITFNDVKLPRADIDLR